MKTKVYLRIARDARGRAKTAVTSKPTDAPLYDVHNNALPTVAFAILVDIPGLMFDRASQVLAEITVPEEDAKIAAEVVQLR
jgi:hypothetical protein